MKNRFRIILVLACALLLILTGCGGNAGQGAAKEASVPETEFELVEEPEIVTPQAEEEAEDAGETEELQKEEPAEEAEKAEEAEETEESEEPQKEETAQEPQETGPSESDTPTGKDELALYIHTYGHLPDNFITKNEAKALGWVSTRGNLTDVAPGCSIGGDRFTNYEGVLPDAPGRKYTECDVNYKGGYRGGERIVFSNDGLIYYTGDHYETFELLYGEE